MPDLHHNPTPQSHHPQRAALARVALFWLAYLAVLVLAAIPRGLLPPGSAEAGPLLWGAIAVPVLLMISRAMDRRAARLQVADSRSEDGPPLAQRLSIATLGHLMAGAAIGIVTYVAMVVATSVFVAPVQVAISDSAPPLSTIALSTASTVLLAWMEELGFRGFPLRTLASALGTWRAQAIVAIAFALSHLAYGWPLDRIALGVLPFALLFGAVAQWSGGLAMPIGVHAAVNLARVAMGETNTPGLLRIDVDPRAASALSAHAPWVAAVTISAIAVLVFALAHRENLRENHRAARREAQRRVHDGEGA
jgi:membrane protease YdiL (CAAX protease family)